MDEITGIISTNAVLDREQQDSYVLTVQAMDMAVLPLTGFAQVCMNGCMCSSGHGVLRLEI